jgi:hypothetical protein
MKRSLSSLTLARWEGEALYRGTTLELRLLARLAGDRRPASGCSTVCRARASSSGRVATRRRAFTCSTPHPHEPPPDRLARAGKAEAARARPARARCRGTPTWSNAAAAMCSATSVTRRRWIIAAPATSASASSPLGITLEPAAGSLKDGRRSRCPSPRERSMRRRRRATPIPNSSRRSANFEGSLAREAGSRLLHLPGPHAADRRGRSAVSEDEMLDVQGSGQPGSRSMAQRFLELLRE